MYKNIPFENVLYYLEYLLPQLGSSYIIIALAFLVVACGGNGKNEVVWKSYNSGYFTFEYPANWKTILDDEYQVSLGNANNTVQVYLCYPVYKVETLENFML